MTTAPPPRIGLLLTTFAVGAVAVAGVCAALLAALVGAASGDPCAPGSTAGPGALAVGPGGSGQLVGATEYGGPGDPSSGSVGSSGANLIEYPDSYAELGGSTFQTATAMGGLPYMTPLRISWGGHSVIAYKRDIGFGGGPIDDHPRVIDLWWRLAVALGIPYDDGLWSGLVRVAAVPVAGSARRLAATSPSGPAASTTPTVPAASTTGTAAAGAQCPPGAQLQVPLAAGSRAVLLSDGQAAAPADAPAAVKAIIAAGNQIVGKPYVYGGGHGLPLEEIAPSYDCSSSVEHLLFGGGLLPADYDASSSQLESFGAPGLGRWVTLYASGDHVFMYVAGLRWDTHNAAGPGDGSTGIGWHPLVRSSAGFVARHPVGL